MDDVGNARQAAMCCFHLFLILVGELENFKSTLASYDDQVKLERNRLKEEHHQCTQIDLNNKKNQALGDFVAALQKEPRDGNKILQAVQRYVKICTQDRLHKWVIRKILNFEIIIPIF